MDKKLILIAATRNNHKITEFRDIFSEISAGPLEVLSEEEAVRRYGADGKVKYIPPKETGKTFAANALLKAVGIHRFLMKTPLQALSGTSVMIVADDSGLCVDALGGAPGVLSARYASKNGKNASDSANVEKLLREMESVPDEKRNASFVCEVAAILIREATAPPFELMSVEGHLSGMISRTPRGENGFGYDSVLYLPEYGKCVAELDPECKNRISHRGQALRKLAYGYYGTY